MTAWSCADSSKQNCCDYFVMISYTYMVEMTCTLPIYIYCLYIYEYMYMYMYIYIPTLLDRLTCAAKHVVVAAEKNGTT